MNFNTNSYMNYPYCQNGMIGVNPYLQPQQQQSTVMPGLQQGLNGKIVESQDIVSVTEVPIGGYGVFPKADLTEIYVKTWNNASKKMDVLTYTLSTPDAVATQEDVSSQILERVGALEQKLDEIYAATAGIKGTVSQQPTLESVTAAKEVTKHVY